MAPKVQTSAPKLAAVLKYFHDSAVAHSIKDLEKALPSVASVNGMQVKDYLQALSDESQIRVEKIGSGNWYWSFPGEAKKVKQDQVQKATEERDKAAVLVQELQTKLEGAAAAREEGDDALAEPGQDRASLAQHHAELVKELQPLQAELASYSENDPVEVDKMRQEAASIKQRVELWTEHIQTMECHLRDQGMSGSDRDTWLDVLRAWYGDQFDDEDQGLKEVM